MAPRMSSAIHPNGLHAGPRKHGNPAKAASGCDEIECGTFLLEFSHRLAAQEPPSG